MGARPACALPLGLLDARRSRPALSSEDSSLVRRSGQILALQVLLQARGLVQVPFLTRALRVEEFGTLTLALAVAGAGGVLALLGLHTGFLLNVVRVDPARTRSAVATVLAFGVPLVALTSLAVAVVLGTDVARPWVGSVGEMAGPVGLLVGATAVREIATVVPRARQNVGFHWANSLLSQYGGLALGLVMVVRGEGPRGFVLGLGVGTLAAALWAIAYSWVRSEGPSAWDGAFAAAVARTAAPVVPMALAQTALLSLDYVYVTRFQGAAALATYGLAYTFASPLMFGVAALNFTLLPEYVRRQRQGDAELVALVDRLLGWGWTAGLLVVAAGVALGPWLVGLVAGAQYVAAGRLLPAILASYVLFTLGQVLHVVRSARLADVGASAVVTVACALLAAGLGLWLIPVSGIRGAAAITLACFVVYFLGMAAVVKPVLPGPLRRLRPTAPLVALAAAPLADLCEGSALARGAAVIVLTGVAASGWPRATRGHNGRTSGSDGG